MADSTKLLSMSKPEEVESYLTKKIPPAASWSQTKQALKNEGLEFGETEKEKFGIFRSKKVKRFSFNPVRTDWKIIFQFKDAKFQKLKATKWLTGP